LPLQIVKFSLPGRRQFERQGFLGGSAREYKSIKVPKEFERDYEAAGRADEYAHAALIAFGNRVPKSRGHCDGPFCVLLGPDRLRTPLFGCDEPVE
jgi:hypothetical protein